MDYLSGDLYRSTLPPHSSSSSPFSIPNHSSTTTIPPPLTPTAKPSSSPQPILAGHPIYDEPRPSAASWEASTGSRSIPPPPSRYNQRQQYFEQQHHGGLPGSSNSSSSSGSSYDSLVNHAQGLSLNSPTQSKSAKQEDALFKDLVDFAKAKSSSSSSSPSKPNRSYWLVVAHCLVLGGGLGCWYYDLFLSLMLSCQCYKRILRGMWTPGLSIWL